MINRWGKLDPVERWVVTERAMSFAAGT